MRGLVAGLALATSLANATAAEAGPAPAAGEAPVAYVAVDPHDDPRLRRTGGGERALRQAGDAVFSRPIHLVRLVAGVAMLPVAVPVAAVVADWHDAVDFCVTGPWWMVFQRPLGE